MAAYGLFMAAYGLFMAASCLVVVIPGYGAGAGVPNGNGRPNGKYHPGPLPDCKAHSCLYDGQSPNVFSDSTECCPKLVCVSFTFPGYGYPNGGGAKAPKPGTTGLSTGY